MKKIVTGLATFFFMLLFLTQVQAGIIWQDDTVFNYGISSNGGTFYYPDVEFDPNNPDTQHWPNEGSKYPANTIDGTALASTQDSFNPDGADSRGSTVLYATSSGGVVTDGFGGLQNKAHTRISITGESGGAGHFNAGENGIDVQQTVISSLQKRFSVNEDTWVYFRGSLEGAVDFDAFDETSSHYANYDLTGSAQISQIVDDGAGVQTTLPPISLNIDNREGEHLIQLVKEIEGKAVEYVLSASLLLQTDVKNWKLLPPIFNPSPPPTFILPYESYELSEPFLLGSGPDNPLTMTTTLNQVPIPPSLLLMGSGLGGLFVIRRRFGRT